MKEMNPSEIILEDLTLPQIERSRTENLLTGRWHPGRKDTWMNGLSISENCLEQRRNMSMQRIPYSTAASAEVGLDQDMESITNSVDCEICGTVNANIECRRETSWPVEMIRKSCSIRHTGG